MQFKFQSFFIATFFLALVSCKQDTKYPVETAVATKIESMEEQVKSVQPKIDSLHAVVKEVTEKHGITAMEQPGVSMSPSQGQVSEETNIIRMLADRAVKIQAELDKTVAEYNALLAAYKAGTLPKEQAEIQIKALETEMKNLELGAAKTKKIMLEVATRMPEPAPAVPTKTKGQ